MQVTPDDLHEINRRLHRLLDELSVTEMASATIGLMMEGIFTELLRAGDGLQNAATEPANQELQEEMNQYRRNLEHLQALLPEVHARLLTERAHLESERSHLEAASAWAQASPPHRVVNHRKK
jgi:chromosome segregation ATPase